MTSPLRDPPFGSDFGSRSGSGLPQPIALVHEWYTPRSVGGAEQVARQLDGLLERAGRPPDLFALVDGESRRPESWLAQRPIRTSFVQRLPWGVSHVQQYLPLLPMAIEQLDLGEIGRAHV